MQPFSSPASCSSSLTLSFLCGRAQVILLCVRPYLLNQPSGAERPGCSLLTSTEASPLSLMYQILDTYLFFIFQHLPSDTTLDSKESRLAGKSVDPSFTHIAGSYSLTPSAYRENSILFSLGLPTPGHFLSVLDFLESLDIKMTAQVRDQE